MDPFRGSVESVGGVTVSFLPPFLFHSELQIRESTEDNSKIIFLISQKHIL